MIPDFGMTVAKRTEDEVWYRGYGEDQVCLLCAKGHERVSGSYLCRGIIRPATLKCKDQMFVVSRNLH